MLTGDRNRHRPGARGPVSGTPAQTTRRNHPRRLGHNTNADAQPFAPLVNAGKATCARCHEPTENDSG